MDYDSDANLQCHFNYIAIEQIHFLTKKLQAAKFHEVSKGLSSTSKRSRITSNVTKFWERWSDYDAIGLAETVVDPLPAKSETVAKRSKSKVAGNEKNLITARN